MQLYLQVSTVLRQFWYFFATCGIRPADGTLKLWTKVHSNILIVYPCRNSLIKRAARKSLSTARFGMLFSWAAAVWEAEEPELVCTGTDGATMAATEDRGLPDESVPPKEAPGVVEAIAPLMTSESYTYRANRASLWSWPLIDPWLTSKSDLIIYAGNITLESDR